MRTFLLFTLMAMLVLPATAQQSRNYSEQGLNENKFKQLGPELMETPNRYRSASGAPGPDYWQNRADYVIDATLDDENQRLMGKETITYYNNSPDVLDYLWVQLDQNVRARDSRAHLIETMEVPDRMSFDQLKRFKAEREFDGGYKITAVTDGRGTSLPYTVNYTMMRIDLPQPLQPGQSYTLKIEWNFNINDRMFLGGRGGYEYFEEDDNYLYTMTAWYPRMAVYSDNEGWLHHQFYGRGEFTLPFGNFRVKMTVPAAHVVGATGELQNANQVLTAEQRNRFEQAKTASKPVQIITFEEAIANESSRTGKTKTWEYYAENVRDFAWTSSRKFAWDAMGVKFGNRTVMAMSYFTKHSKGIFDVFSTEVTAHTLRVYSKYTFDYPYPVAISVDGQNGMEYPMICFNYGRPAPDGTYPEYLKYGHIGVVIHEVGHNFFPMIVNSDERNWTWMDEGLNTFVQFLTEQEWEPNYPSRRGFPENMVSYMASEKSSQMPIMTNSEEVIQFGNNAYGKPATALNILRETVMGRELFDHAFKTYAQRWMFKHPTPYDFFRTMEDASGMDLDWFWRGWFFTTDHVDIAITGVKELQVNTQNPEVEKPFAQARREEQGKNITQQRNANIDTYVDDRPHLQDFYTTYDPLAAQPWDEEDYQRFVASLDAEERAMLQDETYYYQINMKNLGGLVMPIIIQLNYEDGTSEVRRYPAEIWRKNNYEIAKVLMTDKKVVSIVLDPYRETADTDLNNNAYPEQIVPSRFELYKGRSGGRPTGGGGSPMQRARQYNNDGSGGAGGN